MFLAFLYLTARRLLQYTIQSIKSFEKERLPESTNTSKEFRARISDIVKNFHSGTLIRDSITEYKEKDLLPNLVYSILSLLWTVVVWLGLLSIFGLMIQLDIYNQLISTLQSAEGLQRLYQLVGEAGGIFIFIAQEIFPDLALEDGFIVFTVTLLTGFLFLTAAVNLVVIVEDLNRRFVKKFYDVDSSLRSEGVGGLLLLAAHLLLFQATIKI